MRSLVVVVVRVKAGGFVARCEEEAGEEARERGKWGIKDDTGNSSLRMLDRRRRRKRAKYLWDRHWRTKVLYFGRFSRGPY